MGLAKTFLSIGIALVFAAFVAYAVNTLYEPPKYYDEPKNDCPTKYDCYKQINECQLDEYKKMNISGPQYAPVPIPIGEDCYSKYSGTPEFMACQKNLDICNQERSKKSPSYTHARNTFIMLLVIGITAIVGGSRITAEGIGSGFIGGGILIILWSIINSWMYIYHMDRYLKLAGLGLALAVLIRIAHKRLEKSAGEK